jgi:AraC-like DNA-binding protein
MHTVATIAYDAINPFELAVATEIFGFERPELGVPWYRFLVCAAERIAACCGFSSAATLRLHFQRLLHISPQAYRNAFHREKVGETTSHDYRR